MPLWSKCSGLVFVHICNFKQGIPGLSGSTLVSQISVGWTKLLSWITGDTSRRIYECNTLKYDLTRLLYWIHRLFHEQQCDSTMNGHISYIYFNHKSVRSIETYQILPWKSIKFEKKNSDVTHLTLCCPNSISFGPDRRVWIECDAVLCIVAAISTPCARRWWKNSFKQHLIT